MKKLLTLLLMTSCFIISSAVYSSGPIAGAPCLSVQGHMCHEGTRGCVCAPKNEIGKWCHDINGTQCHRGTRGCICEPKNEIGKWCHDINGTQCHRGTRGCICQSH